MGPVKLLIVLLFDFYLTETFVRVTIQLEHKFEQGGFSMSGWTFFFILVGVVFLTSQLFRVIDAIERPARRHTRRRAALR